MSHSFYVAGVAEASLSDTLRALPFENLVVEPTEYDGDWPDIAHIYQDNVSVRAIETAMNGGTLQVRIMAHSSPDDFALAAAITDHVASKYGKQVQPEDNESMPVERWREAYGPEWQRETARTYLQMLVSGYKDPGRGLMKMWGTRSEFHVGPRLMEPLLADPENFSENFFDRVRRLNYLDKEDVFGPSLLAAGQEGTSKQAVFSVLGENVMTALSSQATFVVLRHGGFGSTDDDGQTVVTFDDSAEIAGDSLTWLGDGVALTPNYLGAQWQAILDAAKPKATGLFDDPKLLRDAEESNDGLAEGDDPLFGIDDKLWDIIAQSVVAVFVLTAGADGEIDKEEIAAFQKKLVEGLVGVPEGEIMAVAAVKTAATLEERLSTLGQLGPEDAAGSIVLARRIVEAAVGEEKATSFARALYDIAEAVAMASGGGFLGMGNKIGKEEKAMLNGIRQLLKLES